MLCINVIYSGRLISTSWKSFQKRLDEGGINVLYSGRLISTIEQKRALVAALMYQCPLQRTSHFYGIDKICTGCGNSGINVLYSGRLISTKSRLRKQGTKGKKVSMSFTADVSFLRWSSSVSSVTLRDVSMSFTADVSFLRCADAAVDGGKKVSMSFTADVSFLP